MSENELTSNKITEFKINQVFKTFNYHLIKIEGISSNGLVKILDISENHREWISKERVLDKIVKLVR